MQEARCPTDGKMYDSAPSLHLTAGGPPKLTKQSIMSNRKETTRKKAKKG